MYSSKPNVQILVSLLKAHGVKHAVISPGSRNMALVRSLEHDDFFECHSVVDERSAAYVAVGLSLAKRSTVMLSCTSAQATRNYIPGLTEAYYRKAPVVAITADYRESHIGQGVMQAINQMSIPDDTAVYSVKLPLVSDADDRAYCARLVNEALLATKHRGGGPVHINIPIEEHWDGGQAELLPVKKIDRFCLGDQLPELKSRRILLALGQQMPPDEATIDSLDRFVESTGAVIYTNHLSNFHGKNSVKASLFVGTADQKSFDPYRPDIVITAGGQLGEYELDSMLRRFDFVHWDVNEDGAVRDTYGQLRYVFEMSLSEFADAAAKNYRGRPDLRFTDRWVSHDPTPHVDRDLPLSHAFVAQQLAPHVPPHSIVHLAILSAFRNWNFFPLDPSIECYSNVAAYGIDGCMSTFLGHSLGTDSLCLLVIGDLSFFYDMNSIGIRGLRRNARIVLVNNAGGGEFRLYSHAADREFGKQANLHIAAAGHHGSAQGWVESMGWGYLRVSTKEELIAAREEFLADSDRPILMEVFTTMEDDSMGVRTVRQSNSTQSMETRMRSKVPKPAIKLAKRVLKGGSE